MKNFLILCLLCIICTFTTLFSEYVQYNLIQLVQTGSSTTGIPLFVSIYQQYGAFTAEFVLGKLGDLTGPVGLATYPTFGLGVILLVYYLLKRRWLFSLTNSYFFWSLVSSIYYISGELIDMIQTPMACGSSSDALCHGEWTDILVFSVPLIAWIFWYIRTKHLNHKKIALA